MRSSFLQDLPELGIAWRAQSAPAPRSVLVNDGLAAQLGLDPQRLRTCTGAALLTGTDLPAGTRPAALAYAGHQFGGYSPRLGDGRALLLGEITARDGVLWDVHLKGSGRTPFSRGGDGRAESGGDRGGEQRCGRSAAQAAAVGGCGGHGALLWLVRFCVGCALVSARRHHAATASQRRTR